MFIQAPFYTNLPVFRASALRFTLVLVAIETEFAGLLYVARLDGLFLRLIGGALRLSTLFTAGHSLTLIDTLDAVLFCEF